MVVSLTEMRALERSTPAFIVPLCWMRQVLVEKGSFIFQRVWLFSCGVCSV